jgi:hypothetical protein
LTKYSTKERVGKTYSLSKRSEFPAKSQRAFSFSVKIFKNFGSGNRFLFTRCLKIQALNSKGLFLYSKNLLWVCKSLYEVYKMGICKLSQNIVSEIVKFLCLSRKTFYKKVKVFSNLIIRVDSDNRFASFLAKKELQTIIAFCETLVRLL